ncbi:hypothetical protein AB6T38_06935 [Aliiglaciecola sp. SL4]|uniref:hypothetical protein n=1 Tax=Alteromonadaceae TaxID=72275 RepID=UPI001AD642CE|nr:hypothetical protein [Alteromonas sp. K632G]MBO7920600.1 hypothetical protein [Alteromonas sp. K632G]
MKVENHLIVNLEGLLREFEGTCSSAFYSSVSEMLNVLKKSESVKTGATKYSWGIATGTGILSKYLDKHFNQCLAICACIGFGSDEEIELPSKVLSSEKKVKGWGLEVAELSQSAWVVKRLDVASDLELIRLVTLILRDYLNKKEVTYCALCFRVTRTRKHCWDHTSNLPSFHKSKQIGGFLKTDQKLKNHLRKRDLRGAYGENPKGNPKELSFLLENSKWEESCLALMQLMRKYLPTIFLLLGDKLKAPNGLLTYKFLKEEYSSLTDFINRVYSKEVLRNTCEKSRSAFWFVNTLAIAEGWYKAELEMEINQSKQKRGTLERNKLVFSLREKGMSVRKIAEQVSINKSRIQKILTNENN